MVIPGPTQDRLNLLFSAQGGALLDFKQLQKRKRIPRKMSFGPDLCFASKEETFLIHDLGTSQLPEWVKAGAKEIRKFDNAHVIVLCRDSGNQRAAKLAAPVITDCSNLGIGLIGDIRQGSFWLLPPSHRRVQARKRGQECGHIPAWLRLRLLKLKGCFSPYLAKAFETFNVKYEREAGDGSFNYDDESALLIDFARELARGDRRLFFPLGLLETLKQWERSGSNKRARDHFFHSFNNFFLGLLVLGSFSHNRGLNQVPDRFIRDKSNVASLHSWESLWIMTALFHDPGYMGEHIWSTFFFSLGLENDPSQNGEIPDQFKQSILNSWDTEYADARRQLMGLFRQVCGIWEPQGFGRDTASNFDSALQSAYFDGKRCGHSLVSGLYLIKQCCRDTAHKHKHYDQKMALAACVIAALSMVFHDQHSREVLENSGVQPIPFELLPYASTLVFVDALQDDRRDISTSQFPKDGILYDLKCDPQSGLVHASVDLTRMDMKHWPGKILEYESATKWINEGSEAKFKVNYSSPALWDYF